VLEKERERERESERERERHFPVKTGKRINWNNAVLNCCPKKYYLTDQILPGNLSFSGNFFSAFQTCFWPPSCRPALPTTDSLASNDPDAGIRQTLLRRKRKEKNGQQPGSQQLDVPSSTLSLSPFWPD
jgi:hypothetical protein